MGTLVMAGPDLASKDVASDVGFARRATWLKGERFSEISLIRQLPRPSITYGDCEACNITFRASGSCFRKYHDFIAMKK